MPNSCQLCGAIVSGRRRRVGDFLLCWWCAYLMSLPQPQLVTKFRQIEEEFQRIDGKENPKFMNPFSAVPPRDILLKAEIALDVTGYYSDFSKVLAEYYGIPTPKYLSNPNEVSKDSVACYHTSKNIVYCRAQMSLETAFHEFYHALQNHGIVPKNNYNEEEAKFYAKACIKILKQTIFV